MRRGLFSYRYMKRNLLVAAATIVRQQESDSLLSMGRRWITTLLT